MVSKQFLSSFAAQLAGSVGLRIILVMNPLLVFVTACGPEAPVYHGPSGTTSVTAATSASGGVQPISNQNTGAASTQPETPAATNQNTPASQPAAGSKPVAQTPGPTPLRGTVSTAEKQAMQALYAAPAAQGGCAECHGALAMSEKKGRTAPQIENARSAVTHRNVVRANKWPKDVADTTDDGVDTAQLYASALAELLM